MSGLNSKLHAVCDSQGCLIQLHLTTIQVSDFKRIDVFLAYFPEEAEEDIGDRSYDSNKIRQCLAKQNITACIALKKPKNQSHFTNGICIKSAMLIENMFVKFKDWRCVTTRYDSCACTCSYPQSISLQHSSAGSKNES